jgi:hypothetical protein
VSPLIHIASALHGYQHLDWAERRCSDGHRWLKQRGGWADGICTLAQVPNNLGRLTNLRSLAIGHKLVKSIPEPILQLTGLEELSITFCKLQRLPASLAAMGRLRSLNLQGNPWLQVQLPYSCQALPQASKPALLTWMDIKD